MKDFFVEMLRYLAHRPVVTFSIAAVIVIGLIFGKPDPNAPDMNVWAYLSALPATFAFKTVGIEMWRHRFQRPSPFRFSIRVTTILILLTLTYSLMFIALIGVT